MRLREQGVPCRTPRIACILAFVRSIVHSSPASTNIILYPSTLPPPLSALFSGPYSARNAESERTRSLINRCLHDQFRGLIILWSKVQILQGPPTCRGASCLYRRPVRVN